MPAEVYLDLSRVVLYNALVRLCMSEKCVPRTMYYSFRVDSSMHK